jgi:very-short-patch-repair endonuclease
VSVFGSKPKRRFVRPFGGRSLPHYEGTNIEIKLGQVLSSVGVEVIPQFRLSQLPYPFANHQFDFAIPDKRIVLEADGCKWHCCPVCYPGAERRKRDVAIDAAVNSVGWTIIRVWEHDIKRGELLNVRRKLLNIL